jgi:uncharacterized membrane protein
VLFVRLIAFAAAIVVGVSVLLYMVTGQPRWRRFAWRAFSVAAVGVALVLVLLLFEHLLGSA